MGTQATKVVFGTAAIALSLGLAGCGTDSATEATPSEQSSTSVETSSAPTSTPEQAQQPATTVGDYLDENGITQIMVSRGDATAPQLDLPTPPGWMDVGPNTPKDAYGAIVLESAAGGPNPPVIVASMARLSGGEVDQARILELAPNAVRNQPGYDGPETGSPGTLSGFDAAQIAGTLYKDGQSVFVARKTVVIPGTDATYLLAIDAQGTADQQQALLEAMSVIDAETTIQP
ncbi:MAG: LpqN/LpqT family lipoprotein [Mycobacterium sp.]